MTSTPTKTRWTPAEAAALELPPGRASARIHASGDFDLRRYAPKVEDKQTPHDQDEIYIVISGTGFFRREAERVPFAPGDVLFAAARETHRFEDFSQDFATWVVFYGAKK
jgi:mannose-6-phosphate isomerase-like protein (cupin superfamily)